MHVANSHGWHWISLLIQLLQGTSAEVPCVCTRTFILGSEGWGTCQLWRPSGYSRGTLGSSGVLWGLGSSLILWVWGLHSIAGKFHIRVFHQHVAKGIAQGVIFSSELKPALQRSTTCSAFQCNWFCILCQGTSHCSCLSVLLPWLAVRGRWLLQSEKSRTLGNSPSWYWQSSVKIVFYTSFIFA